MKFKHKGVKLELWQGRYHNGHIAIAVADPINKVLLAALTVNTLDFDFPADELAINAWDDNEEIADLCFQTGVFEDTGKRAENGSVTVEFWKLKEPYTLNISPKIKD